MNRASTNDGSPLVSVIVATRNRPDTLPGCLRSILTQTYRNIEIVVVNDAGIDVQRIIDSLNDKGTIRYVEHPRRRGIAATRNTGIASARGMYIGYLDDDDLFYPEHLETLVNVLDRRVFRAAYTDAHRAHQKIVDGRRTVIKREVAYAHNFDVDHLLIRNFIPTLCILHEKSCLDEVGFFDESLPVLEDWDLWIRLSRKFAFCHVPKVTCEFAWKPDGGTLTSDRRALFRQTLEVIYGRTFELVREKPRVRRARKNYLRGMKILSFLSGVLGERSALFQVVQNALTDAYNWATRFRR